MVKSDDSESIGGVLVGVVKLLRLHDYKWLLKKFVFVKELIKSMYFAFKFI